MMMIVIVDLNKKMKASQAADEASNNDEDKFNPH